MVARAVAEEEFADDRARDWFEQDTFDKLLKEVRLPPSGHPGVELRANLKTSSHRSHLFEVWELTT
jgi:hypothetical protein